MQHTRLLYSPLSPGICSNLDPLSRWCHLIISSSVTRFSLCLQSFLASESFLMSCLLAPGGQSIEPETSASVLSINIQGRFPLGLTVFISLLSKELSRFFSSTKIGKHQFCSSHLQSCLGHVSRICISCRFPGEVNTGTHWCLALVEHQTNVIHWELDEIHNRWGKIHQKCIQSIPQIFTEYLMCYQVLVDTLEFRHKYDAISALPGLLV